MTTPQHHYESIREKLNKAIPTRLELCFGNEVRIKGALPEMVAGFIFRPRETRPHCIITSVTKESWRIEELTILGTPVSLTEILYALRHRKIQMQTNGVMQEISGATFETETSTILLNYDLTKPVSEQSLETLKRIDELL